MDGRVAERAQSQLELAMVIIAIVVVAVAMSRYMTYAVAGRLKASADGFGQGITRETHATSWQSRQATRTVTATTGASASKTLSGSTLTQDAFN